MSSNQSTYAWRFHKGDLVFSPTIPHRFFRLSRYGSPLRRVYQFSGILLLADLFIYLFATNMGRDMTLSLRFWSRSLSFAIPRNTLLPFPAAALSKANVNVLRFSSSCCSAASFQQKQSCSTNNCTPLPLCKDSPLSGTLITIAANGSVKIS